MAARQENTKSRNYVHSHLDEEGDNPHPQKGEKPPAREMM